MNKNKKKYNKKNIGKVVLIAVIVLVISLVGGVAFFSMLNNRNSAEFRSYFAFGDEIVTVKDDKYQNVEHTPKFNNTDLYISVDYVKEYIDEYIYWDEGLQKLTITNPDEVIRFNAEETTYFVNGNSFTVDLPVKTFDGVPYIPESLIESLYQYKIDYKTDTNIVVVYDLTKDRNYTTLKSSAIIRYEPNKKGVIEDKVKKGAEVQIFDEYENYTKVVLEDGKVGYVKTNELSKDIVNIAGTSIPAEKYVTPAIEGSINIVWDMITNVDANSTSSARTSHDGVDILSPTWFKFDRNKLDGTIISYADKDYVNWAHDNGYMVWGLVSDVADAYDDVVLKNVLSNTESREYAIKQLISYMTIYELDGLNIDFEVLRPEHSDEYVQFFRELYPYMKKEGKYLSVDTYVPSDWSTYFRREDVAKSVDYFIIMAYDEHNPSTSAGPVASYNFVEKGITDTLELVPKEKVILGMPFYTRVWKEQIVDGKVQSSYVRDLGMDYAKERFDKNNATYTYDEKTKYYIGEYTVVENGNTVTYKAWLESNDTLKAKVELANKYDLKGVAGWRRGLQGEGTLKMINDTLK